MNELDQRLRSAFADHYSIAGELGRGGMAVVYLAHDLKHDRDVAIKVLHPDLGAALGGDRFLSEIRTTAKLQHPHILPLLDSGVADGLLYYVMPLVSGETLRARLEREQQLPIADALRIAREVASALDYAHRHGVIHRDIKPENILLHDGQAVVADFGIALAVQQAGGQRITQTGLSLGTPQYMSPEQAMGEKVIDARSDIYALAAVTYEMLVGEPPFTGPTVQAIVAKTMTEKPTSLRAMRDTIPLGVEHAVLTGLAKLPADRFASAAEFAAALVAERAAGEPTHERRRGFAGGRVGVAVAWTAAACFAIVAAWAWRKPQDDGGPVTRVAIALPDSQQFIPQWRGYNVAVSHDGARIAYVGTGPTRSTTQLWVRPLDALEGTAVPNTVGATTVRWAPDGRSLFFSSAVTTTAASIVNLDGGQVTPVPGAYSADLGASGRLYSVQQRKYLVRQTPGGGLDTVAQVGTRPPISLTVTPDESTVLLSQLDSSGMYADARLVAVSLASGKQREIGRGVYAQFLSSGHLLYVSANGDAFVAPFDLKRLRTTGPATAIARVAFSTNAGEMYAQVSASDNGTLLYVSGNIHRNRFTWIGADGRVLQRTASEGDFWGTALSPDGSHAAVAARVDDRAPGAQAAGVGNVYVEDLRTGARTQLTANDNNVRPSWTADGRYVLYARIGGPYGQALFERRADGSEPERLVLSRAQFGRSVAEGRWLPDHRTLVIRTYADSKTNSRDIFFRRMAGGDSTVGTVAATTADEYAPAPSPDGSLIAYMSNETGTTEVYAQPFPSAQGRLQVSHGGGGTPRWSRDGRVYFFDSRNHLMIVTLQAHPALAITAVRDVGEVGVVPAAGGGGATNNFDVAPDGRILVAEQVNDVYRLVVVRNWLRGLRRP